MKLLTIQTSTYRKFNVLTIFPWFTKLYFGLSERDGFILDLCALVHAACSGRLDDVINERSLYYTKVSDIWVHLYFFLTTSETVVLCFYAVSVNFRSEFLQLFRIWESSLTFLFFVLSSSNQMIFWLISIHIY